MAFKYRCRVCDGRYNRSEMIKDDETICMGCRIYPVDYLPTPTQIRAERQAIKDMNYVKMRFVNKQLDGVDDEEYSEREA